MKKTGTGKPKFREEVRVALVAVLEGQLRAFTASIEKWKPKVDSDPTGFASNQVAYWEQCCKCLRQLIWGYSKPGAGKDPNWKRLCKSIP